MNAQRHPTIVVGYDGSFAARRAIAYAVGIADDGRIVVVHAREAAAPHKTSRWRELLDAEHEAEGRAILDALLLEGNEELAGVTWETRLLAGPPADAILRVAAKEHADAIVVGSHGYGSVSSLLGSVSQELLRRADRPVTVIPPACAATAATTEAGSGASA